jgi:hypothetical protein
MLDRVVPDRPGQSLEVVGFDWSAVYCHVAENLADECCCHLAHTAVRPILEVAFVQAQVFLPATFDRLLRLYKSVE